MYEYLFPGNWRATDLVAAAIETPLGRIQLDAQVDGERLSASRPTAYASGMRARLLVWNTPTLAAELMLCQPNPALPSGMRVCDCYAAVWRLRASMRPIVDYTLTCLLDTQPDRESGSACSGQGLDAQEWSDGVTSLTIGT